MPTDPKTLMRRHLRLGIKFPHGVAFEEPVEPSVVRQWVSTPEKRAHPRIVVQFGAEYTQAETKGHGRCLNLEECSS